MVCPVDGSIRVQSGRNDRVLCLSKTLRAQGRRTGLVLLLFKHPTSAIVTSHAMSSQALTGTGRIMRGVWRNIRITAVERIVGERGEMGPEGEGWWLLDRSRSRRARWFGLQVEGRSRGQNL